MSTQTNKIKLLKPEPTENWSVQDHFNANMEKIDQFAGRLMIATALSGSTESAFVANLASAVNQQVGLANLPIGVTLTGSAEWAGTTFCQFMLTKIASNACNVHITNGATKDIIARFNISDFNVTSVVDIFSQFATSIVDFGANQQSGIIKLVRSGKIRQLLFDDARLPSDATHFTFDTSTLPASDRPLSTTTAILRKGNGNELYLIWVRNSGTFGQGGGTAGQLVNGTLTWVTA